MPPQNGSMKLPFIVSTDRQKADPDTRRLIRSHVMRGKNRVKPRKKPRKSPQGDEPQTGSLVAISPVRLSEIPRMLCSELSTIQFADSVEPALIADVLSFSTMFSKAMFLLDECISSETAGVTQTWFTPMLFDAAYLHAACFTIQAYFDGLFARTRSLEAQRRDSLYYAKAVRALQERLALDGDEKFSDSTIMTVLLLSGHAYTIGDYESANTHNGGLLKLVAMRGVRTFLQNAKLLIEIVRCDLSRAIDTDATPVLFTLDDIPWPLVLSLELDAVSNDVETNTIPAKLDPALAAVWTAASTFCSLVNRAARAPARAQISEQQFLHNMGAIMYRLVLRCYTSGSLDEAFRMGLLAFLSPVFLNWNRVELPDPHFTSAYRRLLAELDRAGTSVSPHERLWLLMVGAVSMTHEPEGLAWLAPRLRTSVAACGVSSWDGARELLESFLWVGLVYDLPGKAVFESITMQKTLCM